MLQASALVVRLHDVHTPATHSINVIRFFKKGIARNWPIVKKSILLFNFLNPCPNDKKSVIDRTIPTVEHDHKDVAGAVSDAHHDGCVAVVVLLVQLHPGHGDKFGRSSLL